MDSGNPGPHWPDKEPPLNEKPAKGSRKTHTGAAMLGHSASIGLAISVFLGCVLWGPHSEAQAAPLTVNAIHVEQVPTDMDDDIWESAPAVHIPVEGREAMAGEKGEVILRAVYTKSEICFLFRWKDPTLSITKKAWRFDGRQWEHIEGDEDRLAVLFEITRIDKFATRSCAIVCHSPPDLPREKWVLATRSPTEKGDLWHWKAARSAPYQYADDTWLTVPGPLGEYEPTKQSGRRSDAGDGGDLKNERDDQSGPRYRQAPDKEPSAPGALLFEEAVEIRDYTVFKPGDIVPYRMPVRPGGSRADVRALSRHEDGHWTLMLLRRLDTGHEDDVVFDPKKQYSFAIAVFDNAGDDHSKATEALMLRFVH